MVEFMENDRLYEVLLELFGSASRTIDVGVYMVNLRPRSRKNPVTYLVNGLLEACDRGVRVRVVLPVYRNAKSQQGAGAALQRMGLHVRMLPESVRLHAKMVVVDGRKVVVMSANLSYSSWARNREVGMRCLEPEPARRAQRAFEGWWQVGRPLRKEA
jgi:phosphatidylserine/phosphatidylglycerophosphate/cardiolipin synthase-like enzyme